MNAAEFASHRNSVQTEHGEIAYADFGSGPAAVFVHGILLSGYMWHGAIQELDGVCRCIAIDLPGHGSSPMGKEQPVGPSDLADLLEDFCKTLGLDTIDLVGNDTGGAVCQMFAARYRERLRSLALTNCDVDDQTPPDGVKNLVAAAERGVMAPALVEMSSQPAAVRAAFAPGYEDPDNLTDATIEQYFRPFRTLVGARAAERTLVAIHAPDLTRTQLSVITAPTLIAWGTADTFFPLELAHQLRDRIPAATEAVEVDGAKLFWPEERPADLARLLTQHWQATSAADGAAGVGTRPS